MGFQPFTDMVNIYHLVKTGNKEDYETTASITNLKVTISPAGTDILAVYPDLPAYQLYEMFAYRDESIKNGDKVVTNKGVTYYVRGVPQKFDHPHLFYIHCVLEKVVGT